MVPERLIKIIGAHLRTTREAQGRSLDDIATATRISLQFLEQLEEGSIPKLPLTYLDAFVKDYARELGLNLEELIEKINEMEDDSKSGLAPGGIEEIRPEVPPMEPNQPRWKFQFSHPHQIRILVIVIAVIIVGLITMLVIIGNDRQSQIPVEISFTEAVKAKEESLKTAMERMEAFSRIDSLVLEGIALDTVWVKVLIDGKISSEAIFPPGMSKKWYAAESLQVSVGNAVNMEFKLNDKNIGTLSPEQKPLLNVPVTKRTLSRLENRKEQ